MLKLNRGRDMSGIGCIGFIGVGKMGRALLEGVIKAGLAPPEDIFIAEVDEDRRNGIRREFNVASLGLEQLAQRCRVLVIAVKPHVVSHVLVKISHVVNSDKLIVSVAAGIDTGNLEHHFKAKVPVVRAMPNIAATLGQSATALASGSNAREEHLRTAEKILGSVGLVTRLPEELIDAVTGLSGSGPAYVFLFAEALICGGLKVGLPPENARKLAVQTLKGAAAMLEQDSAVHPAALRDMVTTPGGTTIAGLHELEKKSFRDAVISAVEAATKRSLELGRG